MKIYTFYSDTHKELLDIFIKSFNQNKMYNDFELDVTKVEQRSTSGDFSSEGFLETMMDKIKIIQKAMRENEGDYFIFADCDIQFLQNPYQDIISRLNIPFDILAQSDYGTMCAGFFIVNVNSNSKNFIDTVEKKCGNYANDQLCMNDHINMINCKLLPTDKYFTIGNINGSVWDKTDNFNITKNILLHHANYTIGIDNKKNMLSILKTKYDILNNVKEGQCSRVGGSISE